MIQFPEEKQQDAVFRQHATGQYLHGQALHGQTLPGHQQTRQQEAEKLIEAARTHHLGTEFLCKGALDSVAATFKVHAFVVDRARKILD